jgi:hypothetical protein
MKWAYLSYSGHKTSHREAILIAQRLLIGGKTGPRGTGKATGPLFACAMGAHKEGGENLWPYMGSGKSVLRIIFLFSGIFFVCREKICRHRPKTSL